MPPVAVVIPAYNEAERIGETVTAALTVPGVDVVVVASVGSTDSTVRVEEQQVARPVGRPTGVDPADRVGAVQHGRGLAPVPC